MNESSTGIITLRGALVSHSWNCMPTKQPAGQIRVLKNQECETLTADFFTNSNDGFKAYDNSKCLGKIGSTDNLNCPLDMIKDDKPDETECVVQPENKLFAYIQCKQKVFHTKADKKTLTLTKDAVMRLRLVEAHLFKKSENVVQETKLFLTEYGSHLQSDVSCLAAIFEILICTEKQCEQQVLQEIASAIVDIISDNPAHFNSSEQGIWYDPSNFLDMSDWDMEKRKVVESSRLRLSHKGIEQNLITYHAWHHMVISDENPLIRQAQIENIHIIPIWELVESAWESFQDSKKLAKHLKSTWQSLVAASCHDKSHVQPKIKVVHIPGNQALWQRLANTLAMSAYYPGNLTLQDARKISTNNKVCQKDISKLPWIVLQELMHLNADCIVEPLNLFTSKEDKAEAKPKRKFGTKKTLSNVSSENSYPHPQDVMLLIYLCSDMMLRQVLAKKMFMCRLAIPFMVPAANKKLKLLKWPLEPIFLEWKNERNEAMEGSLVHEKINMVSFIKVGESVFSKSKLLNEVLSDKGHSVHVTKEANRHNSRRSVSNGLIEMSHFSPSCISNDLFDQPVLFYNLRGDGCLMEEHVEILYTISTVVVLVCDIQDFKNATIRKMLESTSHLEQKFVYFLTNESKCCEQEIEVHQESFAEIFGDEMDAIDTVLSFEVDGQYKSPQAAVQELKGTLNNNLAKRPPMSIDDLSKNLGHFDVDEESNSDCKEGKAVAGELLSHIKRFTLEERKKVLLPCQGSGLQAISKLNRDLHRGSPGRNVSSEEIKQQINDIRSAHIVHVEQTDFLVNVLNMFKLEIKKREFVWRWLEIELDKISHEFLPILKSNYNQIWIAMMAERKRGNTSQAELLQNKLREADSKISLANLGLEHIIREIIQIYEVTSDAKIPEILADQLLMGHPLEILDGDHSYLPVKCLKAVFEVVQKRVGANKRVFVVSALGIQSSGKSTLLNTMFGLEFAVSAGRCTRGVYAQLLQADKTTADSPFDYLIVLDSEGLRACELADLNYIHDNELATLIVGISDFVIVNILGENIGEMADVLQIVVLAFLRMKSIRISSKRQCVFVHQNVAAVNAPNILGRTQQMLQEQLDEITKKSAERLSLGPSLHSFHNVVAFEQNKTIFFPNLWNIDPPMGVVSKKYSNVTKETKQQILLEICNNPSNFVSMNDFALRVDDIWLGVLKDDFVHSFRNTIAANAFIDIERYIAKEILYLEQNMHSWLNVKCKPQIKKCKNKSELLGKCKELKDKESIHILSNDLKCREKQLDAFIKKHKSRHILVNWQAEKLSSLKIFAQSVQNSAMNQIDFMQQEKSREIDQMAKMQKSKDEIVEKALDLARKCKSSEPPTIEQQNQFQSLWDKWFFELDLDVREKQQRSVIKEFEMILDRKFNTEGILMQYKQQLAKTPLKHAKGMNVIHEHIEKDHTCFILNDDIDSDLFVAETDKVLHKVNNHFDRICDQAEQFHQVHGKELIDFVFDEISKMESIAASPEYYALLAIHVACFASYVFDQMNDTYENNHGSKAQIENFKNTVYVAFTNTVEDIMNEVGACKLFCEVIKQSLWQHVKKEMDSKVLLHVYHKIGYIKHDLIFKILKDIAERECFKTVKEYVTDPFVYATIWIKELVERELFQRKDGKTIYFEFANDILGRLINTIATSVTEASEIARTLPTDEALTKWVECVCQTSNDVSITEDQLEVLKRSPITDFNQFNTLLVDTIQEMKSELSREFEGITARSVTWAMHTSPPQQYINNVWGCPALCPFCDEPCRLSDPCHTDKHSCIQHKPPGITGTIDKDTQKMELETCHKKVSDENAQFSCNSANKLCRASPKCSATKSANELHRFTEYASYFPDWEISSDMAEIGSKFWKWIIAKFYKELKEYYNAKIDVPKSWKSIKKEEAIDSLQVPQ